MRNASLYRVGGTALALGALVQMIAILLHAPQPMDLAGYAATSQGRWMASHWMIVIGSALMTAGLFALARHLFTTKSEGWAVVGFGIVIASLPLWIAIVAPEILAFPLLAQSTDPSAPQAYAGINLNLMSLMHVAGPLFWIGVTVLAVAMTHDPAFNRTLSQVGVFLALFQALVGFTPLGENWVLFKVIFAVGVAWLALVGYAFRNIRTGVPV
jgi:hypothetical protein